MTILVTGANGTVSSHLLRSLSAIDSAKVRALVRDPAKATAQPDIESFVGDLEDPASLPEAFAGVDTLWLLTPMGPHAPHLSMNAIWAARQAGVQHIVRLSAIGAAHDAPTRNGRLHALSDAELMASGIGWTILRPHYFMQNQFGSVTGDTVYGALGDGRLGMVDVRDIADLGARVLADPQPHAGKIYTPTGPSSISLHDVVSDLTEVLGTPIRYQPIPDEAAYAAMIGFGFPQWNASVALEYGNAYRRGWGDFVTTDVPDVVGRPARSFAEFARDHADYLRSA